MSDPVTYSAVLPVGEETVLFVSGLLGAERRRRRTRSRRRALGCYRQAVLVLRWFWDGTLIRTDRCAVPGPTERTDGSGRRVDLWWSGKHAAHGGNVQVVTVPDGWPIWTSPVRPGREHDTTALGAHAEVLPTLAEWTDDEHAALGDLGYEGEQATLTIPIKRTADRPLTD